jgi:hypothetical protein
VGIAVTHEEAKVMTESGSNPENQPAIRVVETVGGPRPWLAVVVSAGLSVIPWPFGGPVKTFFDAFEERRRARTRETLVEITEIVGGVDALLSRMGDNPDLQDLLVRGLEAAFRSSYEAKRKLLARAVASAFENDEAIDPANLMVMALSQLEPVHVRALARLARVATESGLAGDELHDAIATASRDEPVPVRATLVQTGVVLPANLLGGGVAVYDLSDFGHEVLRGLRDAGDDSI